MKTTKPEQDVKIEFERKAVNDITALQNKIDEVIENFHYLYNVNDRYYREGMRELEARRMVLEGLLKSVRQMSDREWEDKQKVLISRFRKNRNEAMQTYYALVSGSLA